MHHPGRGGVNQQGGGGPRNQQGGGGPRNQQGGGGPRNQQGGGGPRNQQGGGGPRNQQGGGGPRNQQGGGEGMAQDYERCLTAHQDTERLLQRLPASAFTFFQPTLQQVNATQHHLANLCHMLWRGIFVPPPAITAVLAASAGAQAALMAAFCHLEERVRALEEHGRVLQGHVGALLDDRQRRERAIHSGSVASQLDHVACLAVFRGEHYRRGTTIGQLIKLAAAGGFTNPQHRANFEAFKTYLVQQGISINELQQLTKPMRQGRVEDAHLMNAAESVRISDLEEWADEVGEQQGQDVRQALALLAPFALLGATAEQRQLPLRKELTNYVRVSTVVDAAVGGCAGGGVGGGCR